MCAERVPIIKVAVWCVFPTASFFVKRLIWSSGGGLGGLAFSVAAAKYAHLSVEVYESAAPGFTTFGAGIGLWPRTWDVLSRLGVTEMLSSSPGDEISGCECVKLTRQIY